MLMTLHKHRSALEERPDYELVSKSTIEPPKKLRKMASDRKRTPAVRGLTCKPEQATCRYANKVCLNLRAKKKTGGLHTYCEYHRDIANANQRRLDQRNRTERRAIEMFIANVEVDTDGAIKVSGEAIDSDVEDDNQDESVKSFISDDEQP